MKIKHRLIITLLVVGPGLSACSTPSPATNQRSVSSNATPSNTSQSNSSQKPAQQSTTTGSIEVHSSPPGARVLLVPIDEGGAGEPQQKGSTPAMIAGLAPGKYTVDLEKPGYKFFQKEVTVKAGTTAKVTATLRKQ